MDTVWLTYHELADRLGIGLESARTLVKRKRWPRQKGNNGLARIEVPLEHLAARPASPGRSVKRHPDLRDTATPTFTRGKRSGRAGHANRTSLRALGLTVIDIPPQRHAGDLEGFANVPDGRGFVGIEFFHQSDLFGGEGFAPAPLASSGPGSDKSCLGALADDVALKLRKGAEDVEDELPAAGCGVDLLGGALEADALAVKLRDRLDQVLEGSAQAIQAPHHEGVAFPQMREGLC
jgi:hypothetical protein